MSSFIGSPPSETSMTLVSTTTLTGAATSLDITGLDINSDGQYLIIGKILSAGVASRVNVYINNDTTATNYYCQEIYGETSTVGAQRQNNAQMIAVTNGNPTDFSVWVSRDVTGYGVVRGTAGYGTPASKGVSTSALTTKSTVTNITQITFTHGSASGLGTGTSISVYKVSR